MRPLRQPTRLSRFVAILCCAESPTRGNRHDAGGTIKVDWPILTNLRSDPYERTGLPNGAYGFLAFCNRFVFEFWRFQFVQQEVAKVTQTAIEFSSMQPGASFNLDAVKTQIEKARAAHGQ